MTRYQDVLHHIAMSTLRSRQKKGDRARMQEERYLALERNLPDLRTLEAGISWGWLLPVLGELAMPIARALADKLGNWVRGKLGVGGSLMPTQGRRGGSTPMHGRPYGFVRTGDVLEYVRGADTPQPSEPFRDAPRNVDRFDGGAITLTEEKALEMIKRELLPFIKSPDAFKKKLVDLIKMGESYLKKVGLPVVPQRRPVAAAGLTPTGGRRVKKKARKH